MRFSNAFILILLFLLTPAQSTQAREWVDSTGKFRIDAELIAVRGDKVVLESADGDIISIPIARLSDGDQKFLKELSSPKEMKPNEISRVAPSNTGKAPGTPDSDTQLAKQAESILREACHRCHGEDGTSEGGFNFVADLEKLSKTFAKPGEDSLLLERIIAEEDSVMPPVGEEPRLTNSQISTIKAWVDAGSPTILRKETRPFVTNEQIVEAILADIRTEPERSRRFMRYFTITHLYNAGVSEDELQTYRNAFVKLINSLSWNTDLVIPKPIDPAKTVFGIDMRDLHWNSEIWRAIEEANPYAIRLSTPATLACVEESQTEMPFVRIDWFVFAASKPPLYHTVLNLPESDTELERMLRVNVEANINQEQVIRAAFNRSGVSQNNRLIEWHKSPYGSYWKSYDFGGNVGRQNLFQYPLGPSTDANSFQHDGGEIIFTLPNGLQGYLLVDERGRRIDQGPTNIVSDPKQLDRTVTNGVSCMSCHYTGVIPKKDEVGLAVRRNRDAFDDADDILALYLESDELDRIFDHDGRQFSAVLAKLGITNLSRSGESISAMALRFQQDIDLNHVASEFGLRPDEFLKRLADASTVSRVFSSLRIDGGTIKRDVFKDMFGEACIDLRLVENGGLNRRQSMRSSVRSTQARSRSQRGIGQVTQVALFTDLAWGISSVAFESRGKFLAGGRPDRSLTVFDVENQSICMSLDNLELLQSISACEFTPDGSTLLAAGRTGHVTVYSVGREGMLKEVGQFAGHSKDIKCMAISADGRNALTGGDEKKARYWEISSGRELALIPDFNGPIKAVHVSRDGRTLQATDGEVLVEFDVGRNQITRQRPVNRSWAAGQSAAFSADGQMLAAGDTYNIRLWEVSSGRELPPLVDDEIQWCMTFTPDGSHLVSGGSGKVNLWDVRTQKRLHVQATGHGYVKSLAVSDDGSLLAVPGSNGRNLHVFDLGN